MDRIPVGRASRWMRVKCALFHRRHQIFRHVHHSWAFQCRKCGLEGMIYD